IYRASGTAFFLFFSSRRRHTKSKRDWSSDVCSSDLTINTHFFPAQKVRTEIINDYKTAFETVDAIAVPATLEQGEEYDSTNPGVGASLAGLPAASVAGMHICAPTYADELVYRISAVVETTAGATK